VDGSCERHLGGLYFEMEVRKKGSEGRISNCGWGTCDQTGVSCDSTGQTESY